MDSNLNSALQVANVDHLELEFILQEQLGGGIEREPGVIAYGEESNSALTIKYDKKYAIEAIIPGPALTEDDVRLLRNRIDSELLSFEGTMVANHVLFSRVRIDGTFRYQDKFQILPVPSHAPQLPFLGGRHPFLLEFEYQRSSNKIVSMGRRDRVARKLEQVLATLLHGDVASITSSPSHWVLKPETAGNETTFGSEYRQQGYCFEGMGIDADDYTQPIALMKAADPTEYYNRSGYLQGEPLIPSNLAALFDRFFSLSPDDEEKFSRAAYWFHYAQKVRWLSRSAFFTALISAVESVKPNPRTHEKCNECNRPFSTNDFNEFVDRLASSASKTDRQRFYGIRSKLSHGGGLLFRDRHPAGFTFTAEENQDEVDVGGVEHLVRLVLVNRLLRSDAVPNKTPWRR